MSCLDLDFLSNGWPSSLAAQNNLCNFGREFILTIRVKLFLNYDTWFMRKRNKKKLMHDQQPTKTDPKSSLEPNI